MQFGKNQTTYILFRHCQASCISYLKAGIPVIPIMFSIVFDEKQTHFKLFRHNLEYQFLKSVCVYKNCVVSLYLNAGIPVISIPVISK